jgi:hypothetical protein
MLFKNESFVANPPSGVPPKDRICLQGIAFTMEAAMQAIANIKTITGQLNPQNGNFDAAVKLSLYANAWNVVDQIHMLRQLLDKAAKGKPLPQPILNFTKKYEQATTLRNRMDHLDMALDNLGRMKKAQSLAFGSLGYYHALDPRKNANGEMVEFGLSVIVMFGNLTNKHHKFPLVSPRGFGVCNPTGFFQLSAFDVTFPFYRLEQELPDLADFLDASIEPAITKQLQDLSKQMGSDISELLSRSQSFVMVAEMESELAKPQVIPRGMLLRETPTE